LTEVDWTFGFLNRKYFSCKTWFCLTADENLATQKEWDELGIDLKPIQLNID
jgi:hypothetical protein